VPSSQSSRSSRAPERTARRWLRPAASSKGLGQRDEHGEVIRLQRGHLGRDKRLGRRRWLLAGGVSSESPHAGSGAHGSDRQQRDSAHHERADCPRHVLPPVLCFPSDIFVHRRQARLSRRPVPKRPGRRASSAAACGLNGSTSGAALDHRSQDGGVLTGRPSNAAGRADGDRTSRSSTGR